MTNRDDVLVTRASEESTTMSKVMQRSVSTALALLWCRGFDPVVAAGLLSPVVQPMEAIMASLLIGYK